MFPLPLSAQGEEKPFPVFLCALLCRELFNIPECVIPFRFAGSFWRQLLQQAGKTLLLVGGQILQVGNVDAAQLLCKEIDKGNTAFDFPILQKLSPHFKGRDGFSYDAADTARKALRYLRFAVSRPRNYSRYIIKKQAYQKRIKSDPFRPKSKKISARHFAELK